MLVVLCMLLYLCWDLALYNKAQLTVQLLWCEFLSFVLRLFDWFFLYTMYQLARISTLLQRFFSSLGVFHTGRAHSPGSQATFCASAIPSITCQARVLFHRLRINIAPQELVAFLVYWSLHRVIGSGWSRFENLSAGDR